MAKAAGITIESRTYTTQGELVKDYLNGQLDLAWLGNAPALEIVESGKASVFASMVFNPIRSKFFTTKSGFDFGIIIVTLAFFANAIHKS